MSIVEMQKVHLVSLRQHKDGILKSLQRHEVLDIQTTQDSRPMPQDLGDHELQLAEIKSAISFLEGINPKKKSFVETLIPYREVIKEEDFKQTCQRFNCNELLENCKSLESELANRRNLIIELQNNIKKLVPWKSLAFPLKNLACTTKTCNYTGGIRTREFVEFARKLEKLDQAAHLEVARQTKEETHLIIIYLTSLKKRVDEFVSKSSFELITLPSTPRTPSEEIRQLRSLLQSAEKDIDEFQAEARQLLPHLFKLKFMYDMLLDEKLSLAARQKFANTQYTFVIEGWIKKNDLYKIKQELRHVTDAFEIFPIPLAKDEKPPVVLKNPGPLSPFELITKIYGTPKSDELDPSIPLSFFFALFFGLCLGDFGYGIALIAISFYFLKRYRLPEGGVNLFKLLMIGGGVAMLVGLLTGSYFGYSPKEMPALLSIQIIDPIKSPLTMLIFSLALGVIQILYGISLQMYHHLRDKEYVKALLDDALWMFFLGSLVLLIVAKSITLPVASLAANFSIAGGVLLVLTQGRHKKNIIQKFLSGLLSLYKISGYMGDTLSYSRLLALGMSTTIIGSVINILAGMLKGGVPVLGFVLMVVLLIFGHLFNLVIGTLGAFVHSTRLQMVEFFSKFYEGGGREFRPFKREAEYTIIKEV